MDKDRLVSLDTPNLIDIVSNHSEEYTAEALEVIHDELRRRNEHSALGKALEKNAMSQQAAKPLQQGIRKRRIVGILTLLHCMPGLLAPLVPVLTGICFLSVVSAILGFTLCGICGSVGGILLMKGRKAGYYLSIASWSYLVVFSIIALLPFVGGDYDWNIATYNGSSTIHLKVLAKSIPRIALGVAAILLLTADLRNERSIQEMYGLQC